VDDWSGRIGRAATGPSTEVGVAEGLVIGVLV